MITLLQKVLSSGCLPLSTSSLVHLGLMCYGTALFIMQWGWVCTSAWFYIFFHLFNCFLMAINLVLFERLFQNWECFEVWVVFSVLHGKISTYNKVKVLHNGIYLSIVLMHKLLHGLLTLPFPDSYHLLCVGSCGSSVSFQRKILGVSLAMLLKGYLFLLLVMPELISVVSSTFEESLCSLVIIVFSNNFTP
jgi:hypothetical protein